MFETIIVPFLAAGFGAFAGSLSAYIFQNLWQKKEARSAQLAAGHRALFAVVSAYNTLKNYRNKVIDPNVGDNNYWLRSPQSLTAGVESFEEGLEFLLPHAADLLLELTIESHRYSSAVTAIGDHVRFMVGELQPALESTGLLNADVGISDIEKQLGVRLTQTGKASWKELCTHVVNTTESLPLVFDKLRCRLKGRFPGEKFITFTG